MKGILMITSNEILSKIKSAQNIAIFAHKNADPDAYGSMFAMREFCHNLGKNADIFAKKDREGYLDHIFPLDEIKTDFHASDYDLVFMLDMHLVTRLEDCFIEEFLKSKNVVVIDHHCIAENDILPTEQYLIKHDYAANCEILTEFAEEEGLEITPKIATYLYTGLMGDTDRFLHNNLNRRVFETALFLMDKKAEIQMVYDYLYRYQTKEQIAINKFLLNNLCYEVDGRAIYAIFTLRDLRKMHAVQEDVKTFSNELVRIKGVEVSFMCMEYSKNYYKVSMRSQKGINTLLISEKQGGGGHINASAFEIFVSKSELKRKIKAWSKELLND